MKYIYLLIVFSLMLCEVSDAKYYNITTGEIAEILPSKVEVDGRLLFNPNKEDYKSGGWRFLYEKSIPRYYTASATNYIAFTNSSGIEVVKMELIMSPTKAEKPPFVIAAEQQYLACWNAFFGATNPSGYTNAIKEEVAISMSMTVIQNQSLFALTHVMDKSFEIIETWWQEARDEKSFHPYPWNQTTNIIIKDIIGNQ